MKISHLLLTGLAVLGFTACSSDDDISSGNNKPGTGAYLSLTFTNPNGSMTRTTGDKDEVGEDGENEVSNVMVLLTQKGSSKIVASVKPPIKVDDSNSSFYNTDPFPISIGEYEVFTLVNPQKEVLDYYAGGGIDKDIQNVITLSDQTKANAYAQKDQFTMMNQFDEIGKLKGIEVSITDENTIENPATVRVPVQRFVAKLRYNKNSDLNIDEIDGIVDVISKEAIFDGADFKGMIVVNGKKKANIFQKWKASTAPAKKLASPEVLDFSTDNLAKEFYNTSNQILGVDKDGNPLPSTPGLILDPDYEMEKFVIENSPELNRTTPPKVGETTGVIFQIQFTKGGQEINDFYFYDGYYYTNKMEVIAAYNAQHSGGDIIVPGTEDNNSLRKAGIKVYEEGIAYYTYWVKDENYTIDKKPYQTIHRNTIYDLKINNIYKMGPDEPGGEIPVDPETPIEEDTYLQVKVEVKPWILSENNIDL